MEKNKRLYAMVPFLMALVTVVACGQGGGDETDSSLQVAASQLPAGCIPLDEFTPMPASWATLNTSNATAANNYDITSNLQRAVTALSASTTVGISVSDWPANTAPITSPQGTSKSRTLYIPPGHWTINATITIRNALNFSIVGDDPATTFITWVGATTTAQGDGAGGFPDMFRMFDVASVKFSRLTLDGNARPPTLPGNLTGARRARVGVHLFQSECYEVGNAYGNAVAKYNKDLAAYNAAVAAYNADHTKPLPPDPPVAVQYSNKGPYYCDMSEAQMQAQLAITGVMVAATGVEFDDDVFQKLEFGLVIGHYAVAIEAMPFDYPTIPTQTTPPVQQKQLGFSLSNLGDGVVRRSRFDDISAMGINIEGDNIFNWLVSDSEFTSCFQGIRVSQKGGVHVVNNHFDSNGVKERGSWTAIYASPPQQPPPVYTTGADLELNVTIGTVVRGNSSTQSRQFLQMNPFGLLAASDVTGNYIKTPYLSSNAAAAAIEITDAQTTLFDNYIEMTAGGAAPPVGVLVTANYTWGYLDSMPRVTDGGNTFVTTDPNCDSRCANNGSTDCSFLKTTGNAGPNGTGVIQRIVADQNFCYAPGVAACPSPVPASRAAACSAYSSAVTPAAAPLSNRAPAEDATKNGVAAACAFPGVGCAASINAWLTKQTQVPGTRPLLFFPVGQYYLDSTIEIPKDLDVVIAGEGDATRFFPRGSWPKGNDSYIFHFNSPSKASIRDLHVEDAGGLSTHPAPGGMLVDSTDDVGGLVFLDAVSVHYAKSGFDVLGLDNVAVRAEMSGGSSVERAIGVTGGGKASASFGPAASSNTQGLLMVAGGTSSLSSYAELKNWGKVVLVGVDNEGGTQGMDLNQSGYLSFATGRHQAQKQASPLYADQPNMIVRSTFRGRLTLMNLNARQSVLFAGAATPDAMVLSLDNWYEDFGVMGAGQPSLLSLGLSCNQPAGFSPIMGPNLDCSFYTKLSPTAGQTSQMALQDGSRCIDGNGLAYCANAPLAPGNTTGIGIPAGASAFVTTMLADERAARMAPPFACSPTAVRVHRVSFTGANSAQGAAYYMGAGVRVQRN